MKRNLISIFLIVLFLFGCASSPEKAMNKVKDSKTFKFISRSFGEINTMPTYKYLGDKDFSDAKAIRRYYVWVNEYENKYIMIYDINVLKGKFPENLQWINPDYAIYNHQNRAAFTSVAGRAAKTLDSFNIELPDCYILAEEVHVNKERTECVFRILIAPDPYCSQDYLPVMEELDRVTVVDPLGQRN